jgi:hypothetical protein
MLFEVFFELPAIRCISFGLVKLGFMRMLLHLARQ